MRPVESPAAAPSSPWRIVALGLIATAMREHLIADTIVKALRIGNDVVNIDLAVADHSLTDHFAAIGTTTVEHVAGIEIAP